MYKLLIALGVVTTLTGVASAEPSFAVVSPRAASQSLSPSLPSNIDATTTFSISTPDATPSENRSSADGFRSPTAPLFGNTFRG